MKNKRHEQGG